MERAAKQNTSDIQLPDLWSGIATSCFAQLEEEITLCLFVQGIKFLKAEQKPNVRVYSCKWSVELTESREEA